MAVEIIKKVDQLAITCPCAVCAQFVGMCCDYLLPIPKIFIFLMSLPSAKSAAYIFAVKQDLETLGIQITEEKLQPRHTWLKDPLFTSSSWKSQSTVRSQSKSVCARIYLDQCWCCLR